VTSLFAAVELLRRKGGAISTGLNENYQEMLTFLKGVQTGSFQVPGLSPRTSPGIAVSNIMIDNRYPRAKVRVVSSISFPIPSSPLGTFTDRADYGYTQ